MQHPPKRMARKAKGRKAALILTLLVLALAAAFVMLLPSIKAMFPASTTYVVAVQSPRTFEMTPVQTLQSVTITPEYGESYTLEMHEGTLMLVDGAELVDINDTYAENILGAVTQIVGQGVVAEDAAEVEDQLEAMGLTNPSASARMRYTDGSEATLIIGAPVPNTTYAYCQWSGSPAVYMCDSGVVDALNLTRSRLLPVAQPVIFSVLLNRLTLRNTNGAFEMTFVDGAFGTLVSPVSYPLNGETAERLTTAVQNFRLGTMEAVVTDENRALYGFDDPLCVIEITTASGMVSDVDESGQLYARMVPGQAFRFVIGRAEGEFFYTCEYEGKCYMVSRFLLETLTGVTRQQLLSRNPADVGDLMLRNIYIESPKGTVDMQIVRRERVLPNNELEVDAYGQLVYDTVVTVNGAAGTVEMMDELISRLDALTVLADAPSGWTASGEPRWRIVLQTETGLVRTVEAWRLDLFTDVIVVDGVALHCVDGEAIDIIVEGLTGSTLVRDR